MKGPTHTDHFVAITPNGRFVVSVSPFGTLREWKLKNGRCVKTIKGQSSTIRSVAFHQNWPCAFSGNIDKTIRVWTLNNWQNTLTLEGHTDSLSAITLSPDGRFLVSGSEDKTLRLWELPTGRCIRILEGHTGTVESITIFPDGRYALSASFDETLRVWELGTGRCIRIMAGHTLPVKSVAIFPDGRHAISASIDETLRVWELETGRCIRTLEGHTVSSRSVVITLDGNYAIWGSNDKSLELWGLPLNKQYKADTKIALPKSFETRLSEETVLNDAIRHAEVLYKQGDYKGSYAVLNDLWDSSGLEDKGHKLNTYLNLKKAGRIKGLSFCYQVKMITGHPDGKILADVSIDGKLAVSISTDSVSADDKAIRLWDLDTCRCVLTLEGHTKQAHSIAISHDGKYAITASNDDTLRVWNLVTEKCVHIMKGPKVGRSAFTPDGKFAVSATPFINGFMVWNLTTGQCIHKVERRLSETGLSVAISPDGNYAIFGGKSMVQMWELSTGNFKSFKGHKNYIETVTVTPDCKFVLSGSRDKTLRVWEPATGRCIHTLEGHQSEVNSVTCTPDSKYAVSGSYDRTIRVWELETGRCIRILKGHQSGVSSVTCTSDGMFLLSGSYDKTLRLWQLIWGLEFPDVVDWDDGVRPYLEIFLTLRDGKWTEEDFEELITELAEKRGYGWVRPEGIRRALEKMTLEWKGAPRMLREKE